MAAAVMAVFMLVAQAYSPPRTRDGHPDLQGIWQTFNSADSGVESHAGSYGISAGLSVIVDPPDGAIPYQPWALAKKHENFANRETADPIGRCYLAGVPRTMYLPYPLRILQTPEEVMIFSEYVHTVRWIPLTKLARYDGYESWMGDPRGRWEGDTLVVETTGFNDRTWFDRSGDFHSDALKLVERFTRTGPNAIAYEASIEDPKVFTRSWTMRMTLYRRDDMDQILENECYIYQQELR